MHDTFKELERACERSTKELCEFMDRIEQNKNVISPADLNVLSELVETIKNSKSAMKKIIELDDMMDANQNEYSGHYYTQPMWDRRYSGANNGNGGNYSGNSYHGQYTIATGNGQDGYSGRNMRRSYSRGDDTRMELEEMLNNTRDPQEAEAIRKILNKL